jgi:multisubunit Na+/H+ antiporter MnhC subunit
MSDVLRDLITAMLICIAVFLLNVSSPDYRVVLSMATASSALAVVLLVISARRATGRRVLFVRSALVFSIAITSYAAWGTISAL